ncbi:MAG: HAD family phosphatase [Planctomycetota bacterium]|nr:MAG: HAD family phosphatase [Planctomycetota bacterium]
MGKIKAVIFDWGGVLIDDPEEGLMRCCSDALGVLKEEYTKAHKKFAPDFRSGSITEDTYWGSVCGELDVAVPQGSLWGRAFEAIYRPKEEMFALVNSLGKSGYKTALLSNAELPTMEYFYARGYDMFDVLIFSCAEGTKKPERRIYELALERLGTKVSESVFIDDKNTCIEGAKAIGLNTILFESIEQVKTKLSALGVKI